MPRATVVRAMSYGLQSRERIMVCSTVLSNARFRYNLGHTVTSGSDQATRMIPGTVYQKSIYGSECKTYIGQESILLAMFTSKPGD
jgi:hypothetical protein